MYTICGWDKFFNTSGFVKYFVVKYKYLIRIGIFRRDIVIISFLRKYVIFCS